MRIALLGYGRMGHTIEKIALERGHTLSHAINIDNQHDLALVTAASSDVAIEFSEPGSAFGNITHCLKNGVPVVVGTTGWLEKLPQVEELCRQQNGTFFYASNFSIGVNIFFRLNEILAGMMKNFPEYTPEMEEIHHIHKKDAPSGTAITLAEGLLSRLESKKSWVLGKSTGPETLPIFAKREGEVPGTHSVTYKCGIDEIEIKHAAHSRHGFALGAVKVAEWIKDKKGILNMQDFIKL